MKAFISVVMVAFISVVAVSQTCTAMFPMELGVKFQHSNYKGDGTLETIVDATVTNVSTASGSVNAQVELVGNLVSTGSIYNTTMEVKCNGDVTYMDPSENMPPGMIDQFINEYNGRIEKSALELPYNLQLGDELSDSYFEVFATVSGMEINLSSQTYGRKVTAKENVETLAGNFECFLIESTTHLRMDPNMIPPSTTTQKHWVARGVGTVKIENYKDGNLENYVELTGFRR
ncbi:hypothetical protein QRD02_10155 [Aequorivita sp. SDUM287046]|uniref:DUF3108 domain-containing protein n=1 Tax=Aequorivita aurantiaca TaxID=3053356 RepID=A0ABT8DNU4_9FLAO|nr:hypothetical protein [Aequorivita aurantiaca]MDN3724747.1 hypothetical protein [Aequorivita aurantiaca]